MIKDRFLKIIFIPLLGILISTLSGMLSFHDSTGMIIGGLLYFIGVSWCIWRGTQWMHGKIRTLYAANQGAFSKIAVVCFASSLYAFSVSGILGVGWLRLSEMSFSWNVMNRFILLSIFAVIIFTLVYEILYLSKERELDTRIVSQLDNELIRVEMIALRNELDPHFIYNSLNTLSHLISTDAAKAESYNQKLAHLYQYFLNHNNKELVEAEKEISFIREYFQLLQMVYDNRMFLSIEIPAHRLREVFLIPCSLQLLVENAIKHNQFTFEHPLRIRISVQEDHILVSNTLNSRKSVLSTKVGLRNLTTQYKLLAKKKVLVEKIGEEFQVRLPLITAHSQSEQNDLSLAG